MTKRHMEYAAAYVRGVHKTASHTSEANAIRDAFAALFAEFNPRFRRDQFDAACAGQDYDAPTYSGRKRTVRYSQGADVGYQPYQPKTGEKCNCRPGTHRDNCARCEGTGWVIDFAAIRARTRDHGFSGPAGGNPEDV